MDQRIRRLITMGAVALVCLVLITAPVPAAQRDPLKAASLALSAHLVHSIHLEGFGASYIAHGPRVPLTSYTADIDLAQATVDDRIWTTPQGFLTAARSATPTVREGPLGTEVSFTIGGRTVVGVINQRNEVDRVQTWVDDLGRGDQMVETLFRDYEKSGSGVWFPTHITQNRGSYPALDVWLSSVAINRRQPLGGRP
ncbi:MAG TPA: hypothetical protein VGQ37_23255 [Vicinamibacterales bacterium]|jgi:hypothetical protein|nr:hypothetical protein [Vicinamibacterales bacterium]